MVVVVGSSVVVVGASVVVVVAPTIAGEIATSNVILAKPSAIGKGRPWLNRSTTVCGHATAVAGLNTSAGMAKSFSTSFAVPVVLSYGVPVSTPLVPVVKFNESGPSGQFDAPRSGTATFVNIWPETASVPASGSMVPVHGSVATGDAVPGMPVPGPPFASSSNANDGKFSVLMSTAPFAATVPEPVADKPLNATSSAAPSISSVPFVIVNDTVPGLPTSASAAEKNDPKTSAAPSAATITPAARRRPCPRRDSTCSPLPPRPVPSNWSGKDYAG